MTTKKQKTERKKRKLEHWQVIALYLMIYDVIAVNAAYFLGLWFRFDCTYSAIPGEYLSAYLKFAPWYTVFSVFVLCNRILSDVLYYTTKVLPDR